MNFSSSLPLLLCSEEFQLFRRKLVSQLDLVSNTVGAVQKVLDVCFWESMAVDPNSNLSHTGLSCAQKKNVFDKIMCIEERIKTFCTTPTAACNGVKYE